MKLKAVVIFVIIGTCFCAPVDDPIRIDLPVYDNPQPNLDVHLEPTLRLPENYPGGDLLRSNQVSGENVIAYKVQAASDLLGNSLNAKIGGGILSAPVPTRETVLEETEGYGSKALSFKENIHAGAAAIFQPKPIVDTISESEKYGNSGDKFYTAGKAIVGGAEGVANFVNSVLEIPGNIFKTISRAATEKLNNLGGKLIGL